MNRWMNTEVAFKPKIKKSRGFKKLDLRKRKTYCLFS